MPVVNRFRRYGRTYAPPSGYSLGAGTDILLALGQSNMSGISAGSYSTTIIDPSRISQFGTTGGLLGVLQSPITLPLDTHDVAQGNGEGPMPTFLNLYANWVAQNRNICVIPVAHGGTGFGVSQGAGNQFFWEVGHTPDSESLYALTVTLAQECLVALGAGTHRVAAALWVQGEANAVAPGTSGPDYQVFLDTLIDSLRADLATPNLPFVIGQMVPWYPNDGTQPTRADIDAVHQATPARKLYTGFAPAVTDTVKYEANSDHYNVAGQQKQGWMLFQAFVGQALNNDGTAPPRWASMHQN